MPAIDRLAARSQEEQGGVAQTKQSNIDQNLWRGQADERGDRPGVDREQ
jgi:hypothetical protein